MAEEKKSPLKEITQPFIDLIHAPRALWGINLAYIQMILDPEQYMADMMETLMQQFMASGQFLEYCKMDP